MSDIQQIVNKILTDKDFCAALLKSPEETLKKEGYKYTPEIIDAIKSLDEESIKKLAIAFGDKAAAGTAAGAV